MSDATIGIGIDSSGARSGAREVRRSLDDIKGAAGKTTGAFDRMKSSVFNLKNALLGLGAGLVAKTFLDVARETENLEVRLKFLTGSAQLAGRAFRDIRDFAATVPFTFQEIQSASANLLVAAKGPEELNKLLRITGDLAATTGLGFQQTAEQIQRAMTAGIASADLFREKGVAALLGFQQGVTTTAEATRKRIFELWESATFRLVGASEEMASTWDGMVSMMDDKWFAFRSTVMDNGPFQVLKAAMKEVDRQFMEAGDSIQDFGERLGIALAEALIGITRFGAQAIRDYGGVVQGAWEATAAIWENWKAMATTLGVDPGIGLLGAVVFGKQGLILAAVGSAAQWIKDLFDLIVTNTFVALENVLRSVEVFHKPVFGDGTLREFETFDSIRERNAEMAELFSQNNRKLLEGIGILDEAAPEETGAANSLDNIADAMQRTIDALGEGVDASDDFAAATGGVADTVDAATGKYRDYIRELELGNDVLQLELDGKDLQARQLEEEARLRDKLGRELIPEEKEALNELIATRERLTEQIDMQEEAERELERTAEKAARETARVWENAGDSISDAFSDALFEGEDLFDGLTNAAKRAAAEIASAMIIRPLISPVLSGVSGGGISVPGFGGGQIGGGGGFGLGDLGGLGDIGSLLSGGGLGSLGFNAGAGNVGVDIAQFFGAGAETQALFGNAAGNFGSIAGIGGSIGGNLLANALLGDRGIGASIGGTLGAIGGSFIPIPFVGTAVGSFVGNAIGGLFGNQRPSEGPTLEAIFGATGSISSVGVDNDGDLSSANQLADGFESVLTTLTDLTGGTFVGGAYISNSQRSGLRLAKGQEWIHFTDEADLINYLVDNRLTGGDPNLTRAAQLSQANSVEGLLADVQSASQIQDFIEAANENLTPLELAIRAVNDQFEQMIEKSKELGQDTQALITIRDKEVAAVREQHDIQSELSRLNAEASVLNVVGGASSQINRFLNAQSLSGVSSLSPLERLQRAQEQFGGALSDVRGGDLSRTGDLTASAGNLLTIGRDVYASSGEFIALEGLVRSQLGSVNQTLTSESFIEDQIATLTAQLDVQVEQRDLLQHAVSEIAELRAQIRQNAAAVAA